MRPQHWLLLISLYFLQGFPSGLLVHAMPPLLRASGAPLELIGLMKLLALPWIFRFLWAPYGSLFPSLSFGAHRSWILCMQSLVIVGVLGLMLADLSRLNTLDRHHLQCHFPDQPVLRDSGYCYQTRWPSNCSLPPPRVRKQCAGVRLQKSAAIRRQCHSLGPGSCWLAHHPVDGAHHSSVPTARIPL